MNPARIAEIAKRVEAASPGPWKRDQWDSPRSQVIACRNEVISYHGNHARQIDERIVPNHEFMAHARTDVPALLEHVESLERECQALRDYTRWVDRVSSERRMPQEVYAAKTQADAERKRREEEK